MDLLGTDNLPEVTILADTNEKDIAEEPRYLANEPADFSIAVRNAQRNGAQFVEVSEKLFKHLVAKADIEAFTYGNPGVTVIKEGTLEARQAYLAMNTDQYHVEYLKECRAKS
jgi:hypothetical protein